MKYFFTLKCEKSLDLLIQMSYDSVSRIQCDKRKKGVKTMNVNKLKGRIVEKGLNIRIVAMKIGIDRSSLYRKLNNEGETLTIKEANKIVEILDMSQQEATDIFFGNNVARCATKEATRMTSKLLIKRKEHQMKQREVAEKLGISNQSYHLKARYQQPIISLKRKW